VSYRKLSVARNFDFGTRGAVTSAQANVLPEIDMEYFGKDGDRMHMMFKFPN
jgi:maltose alpha-D-glucosyltransferase / alpha-amylase